MEADEAVNHFNQMKKEADEVVSRVEAFQQTASRFIEEASEALKLTITQGEEYLKGVQVLAESAEVEKNPLFKELIMLMTEDLRRFKEEAARLEKIRKHYSEMNQLFTPAPQPTPLESFLTK